MNKIIVLGTASSVGKSTIATALCRYYRKKGLKVAPFKALNISLNSYVTEEGLEMGRAQVVQAEACEIKPKAFMNPILMKPSANSKTQVIVNGKVYCTMDAYKYADLNKKLKEIVKETFDTFCKDYEVIILEGSGSCAEINLKETDIANMWMAKTSDADIILVADIDRGGVFASVLGTIMLLDEEDRKRVKGVIINKFRGKVEYFKEAMKQLEDMINIPVLGAMPYFDLDIEDEDSVTEKIRNSYKPGLDIAIIRLPHMSNFTDFNALEIIDDVNIRYIEKYEDINEPDLIIIPGTKNTIFDLRAIKENGIFDKIKELNNKGTVVFGVCGGYQMLGKNINDINGVEGDITSETGFGYLNINTTFNSKKFTKQTSGSIISNNIFRMCNDCNVNGYEIHNGDTKVDINDSTKIFIKSSSGDILGTINSEETVMGTYLHGVFDDNSFLKQFINSIKQYKGQKLIEDELIDYRKYKLSQYDKLLEIFEENINITRI